MADEYVFIVGCPRTGSTLLRHILNKSEKICITSETHFLRRFSRKGLKKQIQSGNLTDDDYIDWLITHIYAEHNTSTRGYWGWLNSHVECQILQQRLLESDKSDRAIFSLLMQVYAEEKRGSISSDLILGEKTPTNLYHVPMLFEWFPQTKIIHTFRDPRGIFVSALQRVKTGKWDLKAKMVPVPRRLRDPLLDPITVLHITKAWFDAVRLHTRYEELYPDRYLLLRFEDLLGDPERQIQRVCSFLQVPFERRMLEEVAIVGSSFQSQRLIFAGLDKQAINRWEEHIHPLARAWFSTVGRRQLQRFGYAP